MNLKLSLIAIIIFHFFYVTGQEKYEIFGLISNENNKPVPYATIGLKNTTLGTISNSEGKFVMYIDTLTNIQLQISCIGFETVSLEIPLDSLRNRIKIKLLDSLYSLPEVVVLPRKYKRLISGYKKTNAKNHVKFKIDGRKNSNLGASIGKYISVKKGAILDKVHFYLKENDFSEVTFRVNLLDKNYNVLSLETILVKVSDQKTGWVSKTLEKKINLPTNFILAIEWIESSNDGSVLTMPMKIPKLGSKHFYKFGATQDWKKFGQITSSIYVSYIVDEK